MEAPHRADLPPRSEAEQLAFFDAALERNAEAERRAGVVVRHLAIAGSLIRLVFAGDRLVPQLTPALAHLLVPPGREPDVTFHIWDSASTGVRMIPPPTPRDCFTDRGDIWGMASPRIKSAFHWVEFSLNLLDIDRRIGLYWINSDESLPYWTKASPLRTLFHWWMAHNGRQLLHGAAVGDARGALLITGKGGVGKSTVALACLEAGMQYIADDYLVVSLDPEPAVFSLYNTAKLDATQVERFPGLRQLVANAPSPGGEKGVINLFPAFADRLTTTLPLVAVATPCFADGAETTWQDTDPVALQRAAAFTTMSQLPHAGRETYAFIHRMIERVPRVRLELGHDLARIPAAISSLLRDHTALAPVSHVRATQPAPGAPRPLVSVIIPVFNGAAFLGDAVASVLAQNYPSLEIIVVDDGSTDDIGAALRALPVDVRVFRQENAGPASARNRGIRDAAAELIAFLDADDLWPEGNLTHLVERMEQSPEIDVIHGRAQLMTYEPGGERGTFIGNPDDSFPYYIGAGLYRRRAFDAVGLFASDLRFAEDTDWYRRARERAIAITRVDEVTLFVRRHAGNMTRGKSLVELNVVRVLKKALDRRRAAEPAAAVSDPVGLGAREPTP